MTIRPTDGLVSRLLQQQSRAPKTPAPTSESRKMADHVNISAQAREQGSEVPTQKQNSTNTYGQKQEKLESQLLGLYTKHERYGSKG
jgi:DNA primase